MMASMPFFVFRRGDSQSTCCDIAPPVWTIVALVKEQEVLSILECGDPFGGKALT